MTELNDIPTYLRKILTVGIQYLGIQRSASDILAILYLEKYVNDAALSIREIMQRSGLSLSSVSSLCSRLEIEGIISRCSDDFSVKRGRRRILYEFSVTIEELLLLGMRKYIQEIGRICRDIKLQKQFDDQEHVVFKELLNILEDEICSFFSEKGQLTNEIGVDWPMKDSTEDVKLKEKISQRV